MIKNYTLRHNGKFANYAKRDLDSGGVHVSEVMGREGLFSSLLKTFLLLLVFVILPQKTFAQNIGNYAYATGTTESLEDLTTGATALLTGNQDDVSTTVKAIGFDFYFMGTKYTHFSANSNGQLMLHTSATASAIGGSNITTPPANAAVLFPMAGDNEVGNGMKMKLVGTKLVVEWTQFYVNYNDLTNGGNMQVWLYPDGKIEYVYGEIYNSSTSAQSRSIGLSSDSGAGKVGFVTLSANPTFTVGTAFTTNSIAGGASATVGSTLIANLGSSANGSRRFFSFTPNALTPDAPTAMTYTAVTASTMTVNWVDSSTNESFFIVTRALDAAFTTGVSTSYVSSTSMVTTGTAYTAVQTGLTPSTTYYYKVVSANEASVPGAGLIGNGLTADPGNFISVATGNWNAAATWQGGVVPASYDNALISAGNVVTINASSLSIANLTVAGTLAYGSAPGSFSVTKDLTVNAGGSVNVFNGTTGKTLNVSGTILNDGVINISVGGTTEGTLVLNGTLVQTVGGSGTFTSSLIRNLTFSNTNTATPNIIWSFNNIKIANNLNLTGARINLGGNKLLFGNGAVGGTLTAPAGTGFLPGAKFSRWWGTATTGASVTAGADPTDGAGKYPFITAAGLNRAVSLARTNVTDAVAGELAVVYNDATTVSNGLSIVDGTYTVNNRYDGNWAMSTESTPMSSSSYTVVLFAQNAFVAGNGNARVIGATAALSGTHQNGTATPAAQRITVSQADLLAGPLYVGLTANDVAFVSVASGDWNQATTWDKGTVPTCNDFVQIASGNVVTVSSTGNNIKNVTIASGGSLVMASGDLTVGCTLNNNLFVNRGTFTMAGGTLTINGSMTHNAGSTFNQSGGVIVVDGNNAGVIANSVPSGTAIVQISTPLLNLTGGTLTIVDPHASTTLTSAFAYTNSTVHVNVTSGHTLQLGDGISTDAGGNVGGFRMNTYVGSNRISLFNLVVNGGAGTNRSVTSAYGFGINGDLTINANSTYLPTVDTYIAGNIINNGSYVSTGALYFSKFIDGTAGSATNAQAVSGTGVFANAPTAATANFTSLFVNNTNASGVTLNVPLSTAALTLTAGKINTSATSVLTLGTTTAAGTLTGGSATAYVSGPFARTIASGNTAFVIYPVGKAAYAPLWLAPTTTAVSVMKAEAFDTNAGTNDGSIINLAATRRWEAPLVSGTVTDVKVRLADTGLLAANIPVMAPAADGIYTAAFGPVATFVAGTAGALNTVQSNIALASANYTGFVSYAVSDVCSGTPAPGNTVASATTICLGGSVTLSLQNVTPGSGVTYVWESATDGTTYAPIAAATTATYVATPAVATYYRAQVTCSGVTTISTPVQITFTNNIITATPGTRCGTGTVVLNATGNTGATVNWYAAATGGDAIGTGAAFTTPVISGTTTYYAAAEVAALTTGNVGPLYTGTTTNTTSVGSHGILLTTTKPNFVILSAKVPFTGTGNITVALQNASGTTITSATATNVTGSGTTPVAIPLNITIAAAGSYRLIVTAITGTINSLGYSTGTYPYSAFGGDFKITNGYWYDATTSNMYLFDLNVQALSVCASPRVPVIATVTPAPVLTLSANPAPICAGQTSAAVTITAGAADYDTYVWTPATGVSGDATTGWTFNPAVTTVYTLNATQATGALCTANAATVTVTVNALPTPIVVTPSPASVCVDAIAPLVTTGGTLSNIAILTENFNDATNTWTTTNNSTGGSAPASSAWTLRADGYTYSSVAFHSNDNSQFYLTNSDAAGSGSTAATLLKSPAFSTVNYSSASLKFNSFLYDASSSGGTVAKVQASIDGVTWGDLQTITPTTTTTGTVFAPVTVALTAAYLNQPVVYVRFNYAATWRYYWGIDNVAITGTQITSKTWSPVTNLYTDAAATVPYVANTAASTVYFKSATESAAVTYTVTATSAAGCLVTNTVDVSVNALPVVVITNPAVVCASTPVDLTAAAVTAGSGSGLTYTYFTNAAATTALATPNAVTTAGTYYIKATNASGCSVVNPVVVTVTTTPAPTGESTQVISAVAPEDATIEDLLANGTNIIWYASLADLQAGVNPLTPSTVLVNGAIYYATQTVNGCTSIEAFAVTVTVTLKTNSFDIKELKYYPNPVVSVLNVSYNSEITAVEVYNMIGQRVIAVAPNATTTAIDMSRLPSGTYIVQFKADQKIQTVKVVKK